MNYKVNSNNDLVNKKIIEKERAKQEYDKKIGDIKFRNGIDFSIEYLKNHKINSIKFFNLDYNYAKNISLYYDEKNKNFHAIIYELEKDASLEDSILIDRLSKKYKLYLAVDEIEKADIKYREQLEKINKKYNDLEKESILSDTSLELKKGLKE